MIALHAAREFTTRRNKTTARFVVGELLALKPGKWFLDWLITVKAGTGATRLIRMSMKPRPIVFRLWIKKRGKPTMRMSVLFTGYLKDGDAIKLECKQIGEVKGLPKRRSVVSARR